MNKVPYAYAVVAYVHDPVAGERLNCALLCLSPAERFLRCLTSKHSHRLEQAFGRFVKQQHERVLSDLTLRTEALRESLGDDAAAWGDADRLGELVKGLLRDQGLSYQASPVRFGLTADAKEEAEDLFARFVDAQRPMEVVERQERGKRHRSDKDVWRSFNHVVRQRKALKDALQPVTLRGAGMEIAFDHAVKNGRYHVVQPISFDVTSPRGIADKAVQWVGKGIALQGASDLAQMFLLVGKPSDPELQEDFQNALVFLRDGIPGKHEIVAEDQVEHLAEELEKAIAHT